MAELAAALGYSAEYSSPFTLITGAPLTHAGTRSISVKLSGFSARTLSFMYQRFILLSSCSSNVAPSL